MQRRAIRDAFPERIEPGYLDLADLIIDKIQRRLPVVTLDREHFLEHGLETDVLSPAYRHVGLQKLLERLDLRLNQLRRLNHVTKFAVIFALAHYFSRLLR